MQVSPLPQSAWGLEWAAIFQHPGHCCQLKKSLLTVETRSGDKQIRRFHSCRLGHPVGFEEELSKTVRVVVQRVSQANVSVAKEVVGEIGTGLCVFVGVGKTDDEEDADGLADKIKSLRIFEDNQGKMNRSVAEIGGEILVVSQFTLYGDCRRGNRPSFAKAASAEQAERLYERFTERLRQRGMVVASGRFQTHMTVSLCNDGPATLILESSRCR